MASRKKACATCTLAKTKCVWKDGSRCERCLRLNKVCSESMDEEVLARKKPLKGAKALQTARARSAKQGDSVDHSTNSLSPSTLLSDRLGSVSDSSFVFAGPEKQELWLQLFRTHVTEHFPFVVVPDYMTSNDLLCEKPLLHNAIMMATCNRADEQVARAHKLREDLARETLVEGKRNLDILQAILVACAYYHVHLDINFQLTNMLAIGSAVLCDMLLNMSLQREDRRKTPFATQESPVFRMEHKERTLEERRIFLGFCYVTTITFLTVHRVETIRNIQYLDQCCQILELTKQYPTDTYLVYLARVTKQAQIMALSLDIEDQLPSFRPTVQDFNIMNSLQAEFEAFRMAQAQMGNLQTVHAQSHMLLVELYLRELSCMFETSPTPSTSIPMARDHPTARCYRVASELFAAGPTMLAGPPSHWTYQECWHGAHAMVVLLKCNSDKRLRDQLALNNEEPLDSKLHDFELRLFEQSKRHASAISDSHNFYLRTTRQIRILRERYTAKKIVDDAMFEPQVSEPADQLYNGTTEPDPGPQPDFESWLGNTVEFGIGDMPAFYGMNIPSFN